MQSSNSILPIFKKVRQISLYGLSAMAFVASGMVIVAIAISMKVAALILAHNFIYPIFIFGDLIRGLELIDLINLLVFAVLGMGFGLATGLLPSSAGRKISAAFLVVLVPVIVAVPQVVKYDLWVSDIIKDDNLSRPQATVLANAFLEKQIGHAGVFGFYLYTGQFPMIPTQVEQMQDLEKLQKQVNSKFVKVSGIPPAVVNGLMGLCFWGIRLFYFAIAVITTIAHYKDGLKIVGRS
ncbi:MAG: hypothetical protein HC920_01840 [Oscillatoriales cyanobacterium SM2_3_0]|nr:hypothetical protein [Oscillatoriales cyanobacterium SM2_3_0]